jgi:hypothetical protein
MLRASNTIQSKYNFESMIEYEDSEWASDRVDQVGHGISSNIKISYAKHKSTTNLDSTQSLASLWSNHR